MAVPEGEFCARYFELAWAALAEDRKRYFNIQDAVDNSKAKWHWARLLGATLVRRTYPLFQAPMIR